MFSSSTLIPELLVHNTNKSIKFKILLSMLNKRCYNLFYNLNIPKSFTVENYQQYYDDKYLNLYIHIICKMNIDLIYPMCNILMINIEELILITPYDSSILVDGIYNLNTIVPIPEDDYCSEIRELGDSDLLEKFIHLQTDKIKDSSGNSIYPIQEICKIYCILDHIMVYLDTEIYKFDWYINLEVNVRFNNRVTHDKNIKRYIDVKVDIELLIEYIEIIIWYHPFYPKEYKNNVMHICDILKLDSNDE